MKMLLFIVDRNLVVKNSVKPTFGIFQISDWLSKASLLAFEKSDDKIRFYRISKYCFLNKRPSFNALVLKLKTAQFSQKNSCFDWYIVLNSSNTLKKYRFDKKTVWGITYVCTERIFDSPPHRSCATKYFKNNCYRSW